MPVPPGTELRDAITGDFIGEVVRPGQRLLVARGGRGGRGNAHFATATHQAPREWEPGDEGEERQVELTLKLLADVGLVGEPNAGKSTLLSVLSAARPKIADYPFTTLEPNLGVLGLGPGRSLVIADIPGIIAGAHEGKGLGLKFLQHVERTRVLAFLVPVDASDAQATFDQLRHEIESYSPLLFQKPFVLVQTKRDLLPDDEAPPAISAPGARWSLTVSAASGAGLDELRERLWQLVREERQQDDVPEMDPRPPAEDYIEWDDDPGSGPAVHVEDLLDE
jgi:GTP-binding protein